MMPSESALSATVQVTTDWRRLLPESALPATTDCPAVRVGPAENYRVPSESALPTVPDNYRLPSESALPATTECRRRWQRQSHEGRAVSSGAASGRRRRDAAAATTALHP